MVAPGVSVRADNRAFVEGLRTTLQADQAAALAALQQEAADLLNGTHPFHWSLEFPEVFTHRATQNSATTISLPLTGEILIVPGEDYGPGFDTIIGNPPFQGGQRITGALGVPYREYLVDVIAGGKKGSADLSAYFFLRAGGLLSKAAVWAYWQRTQSLKAIPVRSAWTNWLHRVGPSTGRYPAAPGPALPLWEVAHLWLHNGSWASDYNLNDAPVAGITPLLTVTDTVQGTPYRLAANAGKSFIGSYVLGMGFVMEPDAAFALIEKDLRNSKILSPFLNGDDINSRPDQLASRWVINFFNWSLERAKLYPDCLAMLKKR